MPMTSVVDGEVVDLTEDDEVMWERLRLPIGCRPAIRCSGCDSVTHAKASKLGFRFFAHNRKQPTCPSNGEGPEHRRLKRVLATHLRAVGGWDAIVEAGPQPGDTGRWRADVLAVGPDRRRVAFEIQFSPLTVEEGVARSERYSADGIETVWVAAWKVHWLLDLACVVLSDDSGDEEAEVWSVIGGCGILKQYDDEWEWRNPSPFPLESFLTSYLATSTLVSLPSCGRIFHVVPIPGVRDWWADSDDAVMFVRPSDLPIWEQEQRRRKREDIREQARIADEANHRSNIGELLGRQHRLTSGIVAELHSHSPEAEVLMDAKWDHRQQTTKYSVIRAADTVPKVGGEPFWAMGVPMRLEGKKWPFAVVCPVASRLKDDPSIVNRLKGVDVYAESPKEAERIRKASEGKINPIVPDD